MTKFEKKILDRLKDHRVVLAYLVITVLNLYLRKVAVWWNAEGIECYYDGHPHMVQGQLWWLIMRLGMLFPILPVHFMKWVATVGDFAMAGAGAIAISKGTGKATAKNSGKGSGKKPGKGTEKDLGKNYSVRGLIFYAVVLIMPFTLMRGIVWGLTDSLGIACMIAAPLLSGAVRKGKTGKAGFAVRTLTRIPAMLLCPVLIIPFLIEGTCACIKKDSKRAGAIACSILCTAVAAGVLGIINGFGFAEGLLGQVNFIKFEALSGVVFADMKAWAMAQAGNLMLPLVTLGLVRVCDR